MNNLVITKIILIKIILILIKIYIYIYIIILYLYYVLIKRNFNNNLRKKNRLEEPMVHESLTFSPHNRGKSVL